MAQDLKDTLQLPKTDFPMRAGLAQREPGRVAHWEKTGLYDAIQANRAGAIVVAKFGTATVSYDELSAA